MFLDEIEEAQKAYEKMLAIFSTPEAKEGFKPHLFSTLALTTAEIYIKKGDYENALTEIKKHETPDLFETIKHAFNLGKIYIATNETAKAKEQLEYVIENGRKLSISKEASKLLEEIS
jgi:tetratricopeptide (TPR) repeat protein